MRTGHYLGVDPAYGGHPAAFVLIRVKLANFVMRDGVICDPVDGQPLDVPESVTPAEYAQPTFEVVGKRQIQFGQSCSEVRFNL